jgi:hypothetical protein
MNKKFYLHNMRWGWGDILYMSWNYDLKYRLLF